MTVAGKRLTQAVFSQIPNRLFIDPIIAGQYDDALSQEYLGWVCFGERRFILFEREYILWKHEYIPQYPRGDLMVSLEDRRDMQISNAKHEEYLSPAHQLYISI